MNYTFGSTGSFASQLFTLSTCNLEKSELVEGRTFILFLCTHARVWNGNFLSRLLTLKLTAWKVSTFFENFFFRHQNSAALSTLSHRHTAIFFLVRSNSPGCKIFSPLSIDFKPCDFKAANNFFDCDATMCKKQMRKCRSLDAYEDGHLEVAEGGDDVMGENDLQGGSSSSSFLLQDSGDELENDPWVKW